MTSSDRSVKISRENLRVQDDDAAIISGVKHLASYSWIEAPTPTIAVPGTPPRWSPQRVPMKVPKDSGLIYIAQNAARHPTSPIEPLFRSIYLADPEFDVSSVDIVTDRNNIRKLLSFVDPSSNPYGIEAFTINAEMVGGRTLLLSRTETKTSEVIAPHEFKGYGHEFEKAFTRCELSNSTGHHRIISYRFGGLSFLVRHEVDGYVARPADTSSGLSTLMGSLSLDTTNKGTEAPSVKTPDLKMTIREEGTVVPLDSTLEIKTRVIRKRLSIDQIAPQLWVSQTPKLARAYHNRGIFEECGVQDVAADIRSWESANQKHLKRLAALLKMVSGAVEECGSKAVIRYDALTDKITVMSKLNAEHMLPEDLYSKWIRPEEKSEEQGVVVTSGPEEGDGKGVEEKGTEPASDDDDDDNVKVEGQGSN